MQNVLKNKAVAATNVDSAEICCLRCGCPVESLNTLRSSREKGTALGLKLEPRSPWVNANSSEVTDEEIDPRVPFHHGSLFRRLYGTVA